ncbi:MAG: phenylalanine--tRNA ligase subunit beta [Methanocellales archaeon]|nr:phenylalanine--tRNA ligase subunit beta [Methanocellales archaeon]
MPMVTLRYDDLEKLIGADKDTIIDRIPMIGADVERIDEEYMDVEFFPDRPDLFSVEGVARAMRGFLEIETGLTRYDVKSSNVSITIEESIKPIRPHLACAVVRGLHLDDSSIEPLMSLQENLHWGIGRDRKKVSIGVHDLSKIKPPFVYKAVDPKIEFVPLDFDCPFTMHKILEMHPKGIKFAHILNEMKSYPLIVDAGENVLSFPPIINSALTMVTDRTKDLFIEVTGMDTSVAVALNIVVTALAERGGIIESVKIVSNGSAKKMPHLSPTTRSLQVEEVNSLLGLNLNAEKIAINLEKMRFGATIHEYEIKVDVPAYRADILHNWDLIEDVAIGYGYDRFKPAFPETSTIGKTHYIEDKFELLTDVMVGLGFSEVMTFTLTNEKVHFENMRRIRAQVTKVKHPISMDQTMIRSSILPSLMEILSFNKHHDLPQKIFEVGDALLDGKNAQLIACASIHSKANFAEIKSIAEAVMREIRTEFTIEEAHDPAFLEGRRAYVVVDGKRLGAFGEIHPDVILSFGLDHPVVAFELDIS